MRETFLCSCRSSKRSVSLFDFDENFAVGFDFEEARSHGVVAFLSGFTNHENTGVQLTEEWYVSC